MTNWRISALTLAASVLLVGGSAHAEGLRCGDRLASTGSSAYEVRATCGDPDDIQHSIETRIVQRRVNVPCPPGSQRRICQTIVEDTVDIVVERWTYDFGSNRFIEYAQLEQGVLVHVWNNGKYGHKDPS